MINYLVGELPSTEVRCNCVAKVYPDGSRDVLVADRAVFMRAGYETRPRMKKRRSALEEAYADDFQYMLEQWDKAIAEEAAYIRAEREGRSDGPSAESVARSKRRAKAAVRDLARSNSFKYFVTFTLDAAEVNRYDVGAVTKKLNAWLRNRVYRDGLMYVLVPEYHKDGAIHFHGLVNDALPVEDSGTITMDGWKKPRRPRSQKQRREWLAAGGRIVYNLPAWGLGFSTAIELYGEREAAIGYVCKYISKGSGESAAKIGGRWYYSGGDLLRPVREYHAEDFSVWATLGDVFAVDDLDAHMVRVRISATGEIIGRYNNG